MNVREQTQPVIRVENLVKRYRNSERAAVDGVSFDVYPGEFFAFLGPNGAGKTTTISIMTTTLAKTDGVVRLGGYDMDKQQKEIRQSIGIVFQNPSLDANLTAEENIRLHVSLYGVYGYRPSFRLMPKAYQEKVMELAKVLGIDTGCLQAGQDLLGGNEAEAGDSPQPHAQAKGSVPGRTDTRIGRRSAGGRCGTTFGRCIRTRT